MSTKAAPLSAVHVDALVGPVAWAVFADNGNIRIWSSVNEPVRKLAEEQGMKLTPLYAIQDGVTLAPERFFAFEFEVWQGDEMVASASGPREHALREAMHYAAQYKQDGPVRVFEVTRTLLQPNAEVTGLPRDGG